MSKMIGGILMLFVCLTILISVMNGGGGVNSTTLTSDLSATATTMNVVSTDGFLSEDYVVVGGEQMTYTGKTATSFTGLDRSKGALHKVPNTVYSPVTSMINETLDFNVGAVSSNVGLFAIPVVPFKFLTTTVPNVLRQGLPFTGVFAFINYIWFAITGGIYISLAIAFLWLAGNLVAKII